jgi:arachidonate 15-lipoxygenase
VARLRPLLARVPARRTGPVPDDLEALLEEVYPSRFREAWDTPPSTPPELMADDLLAALAVSSPFSLYLQSAAKVTGRPNEIDAADFVLDMRLFDGYPPRPGLLAPGGIGVLAVVDGELRTRGVWREGLLHEPGSPSFDLARRLLLCGLNTHLTTLLHNAVMHLGYVTPFSVATANVLPPDHPLRRLLHPALHTTLVGNYQVAHLQIVGSRAFASTVFSHDHRTVMAMIDEVLASFRVAHFDPDHRTTADGLVDAPIDLPLLEDRLALWAICLDYVEAYVGRHYPDEKSVTEDESVVRWLAELDRMLPSGLYDDEGYLPEGQPIGRDALVRLCATFLHVSSVTHDIVNNAVWNYSPLNHVIPTQVPESEEPQDVRATFDLVTTLIGTWKEYNMLLDGVSGLALDADDRVLMDDYVEALRTRQGEIDAAPPRPGRVNPRDLNPSVSN